MFLVGLGLPFLIDVMYLACVRKYAVSRGVGGIPPWEEGARALSLSF